MSTIASKNLYELLGNDPELDPNRPADPPTKVIDKPVARTGKRNAGTEPPARDAAGARGGRAEQGVNARSEPRADDGVRSDRHPRSARGPREGGRGRGDRGERGDRGGRGGRGGANRTFRDQRTDRHSATGIAEHDKQAAQGWGATDGQAEWNDEKAGEAIATAEIKEDAAENGEPAEEPEPEDKTKSYDQYLAEQAEKRLALGGGLSTRQANEGSKTKFPQGTEYSRKAEEENFIAGTGGKQVKAKEVRQKDLLVLDGQYYAPLETSDRGGSRGGRGGRGGSRGGRGDGARGGDRGGRGRGGRGEFRGGAPRGDRDSAPRGARGGFNATDSNAFPALGK